MVVGREVTTPTRLAHLGGLARRALRRGQPLLRGFLDRLGVMKGALLSRVPQRFHAITDEIAKFGTIGLINLGVNFAVFNALLVAVQGSEVKAKIVATTVAATCAYFLNRYWTYRHRPKTTLRREYSLFFLFNAVGLFIEAAIVALAKYGFDQTNLLVLNICTFVGIGLGTVFRFWAYRTHVFKQAPVAQAASAPVLASATPLASMRPPAAAPSTVDEFGDDRHDDDLHDADLHSEELHDEELQDELVQMELDEMLQADEMLHAEDRIRR